MFEWVPKDFQYATGTLDYHGQSLFTKSNMLVKSLNEESYIQIETVKKLIYYYLPNNDQEERTLLQVLVRRKNTTPGFSTCFFK